MSDLTWSDIAYQEEHGYLPDNGSSAQDMYEYFGDPSNGDYDPDEVRDVMHLVAEERTSQRVRELEEQNAYLEQENAELKQALDSQ